MERPRHEVVEDLFHAGLEKGPDHLRDACGSDRLLLEEVLALLRSYQEWSAGLPSAVEPPLPHFGPYRCEDILGVGGMGTVYKASRQDGQFQQVVAIKVLRGSLRSDWYRQRFLSERQILAGLNHPHIARLLDGGMTGESEPYLVMELVEGEPIDAYCRRHHLTIPQRIALFDQVLDAVEYAQRNLIAHRDLKPSNILVNASGSVKLLDFGTSKLMEEDAAATSSSALTPRYASPEQLRGEPAGTASDVFSAGVVLYELLTDVHPFGPAGSVFRSLKRATGEITVPPPSVQAPHLCKWLAGDLDCIALKSLAHDPAARYANAGAFREDIDRHRRGHPVQAKPANLLYRAGKFIRRNRTAVAAGVVLTLGLTGATVFSVWQARRAGHRFNELRRLATFVMADLSTGLQQLPGSTPLLRTSVERSLQYLEQLSADAGDDPALRLEVADGYQRLGDVLGNPFRPSLGDRARAQAAYRSGLQHLSALPDSPAVRRKAAELRLQLAGTRTFGGSAEEGLNEMRKALDDLRQSSRAADPEQHLALARGLDFLGTRVTAGGGNIEGARAPEAAALFEEAVAAALSVLQRLPGHGGALRQLALTENNHAMLLGSTEPEKAIGRHRAAVAWLQQLSAADAFSLDVRRLRASILMNLGWAEGQSHAHEEAVGHLREAAEILGAWSAMDPENTSTMYQRTIAHRGLGIVEGYRNRGEEAAKNFGIAADLHRQLSERDPANRIYKFLRGELLVRSANWETRLGRKEQARTTAGVGLKILEDLAAAPDAALTHIFGACRWLTETEVVSLRKPAKAAEFCRKAVDRTQGKESDAYAGLASALDQLGDRAGAVQAMELALALIPAALPGQPPTRQRLDLEAGLRRLRR